MAEATTDASNAKLVTAYPFINFSHTETFYTSQSVGSDETGDGTEQKPFETILCVSLEQAM